MFLKSLTFDPSQWHSCFTHDWSSCDRGMNCYTYALNNPSYHWSVPGLGFVKSFPQPYYDSFNVQFKGVSLEKYREIIMQGAIADGLIPVADPIKQDGYYLVALRFNDDPKSLDFDWYRQDDDGLWSHKDGWHRPTNLDSEKQVITDPRYLADRDYPVFASFFLAPRAGIVLTKKFPIGKAPIIDDSKPGSHT